MHDASRMGTFFVEYLRKVKRDKNIDIMYIAAPPDEMDMLNRVKIEIMKMLPTAEIYLSTQVKIYWINIEKLKKNLASTIFGLLLSRPRMR